MAAEGLRIAFGYEGGLGSLSGIGRYVTSLHRSLLAHPDIAVVRRCANFCWLDGGVALTNAHGHFGRAQQARQLLDHLHASVSWLPAGETLRRSARRLVSRRFFATGGVALYHEPNFLLREADLPAVVTVHDLAHILHPQYLPVERVRFLRRELPRSLRAAKRVITPSIQVRDELASTFGFDGKAIAVIPSGVDALFRVRERAETEATLQSLHLEWKGYLLFVGTLEPRKNLGGVLRAQRMLPNGLARRFPLVVVGAPGWGSQRIEDELAENCRVGTAIKMGFVPDMMLAALYSGAKGVVLPSHYEGQGFPAFEAIASGTPVLTSPRSPMEEQLGSLLIYASPGDDEGLAQGLLRLIEDDELHRCVHAEASHVKRTWSWERCADRTVALYKDVLADASA